jgi:nucleotide-binding universal stress UspA family protein
MKTLMATDGSDEAATALRAASRLLRRSKNEIEVLCVAPEFYQPGRKGKKRGAARNREEYEKRIGLETRSILENAKSILKEEGIDSNLLFETGSPSEVIVRLASEYDVTVVGARGRYQSPNLGLGPIASRVVEHAPGAVLVARELTAEGNFRVLVGFDGSTASRRALTTMAACFNVNEAEITLLHIKETPWIHLGLDIEWFDHPGGAFDRSSPEMQLEEGLQREAEALLEKARARLAKYNYSVITMIKEGNPATEIIGEAENGEYDLIILGATGSRDTKHSMLGSVSAKVAWQAPCSVAVIKYNE